MNRSPRESYLVDTRFDGQIREFLCFGVSFPVIPTPGSIAARLYVRLRRNVCIGTLTRLCGRSQYLPVGWLSVEKYQHNHQVGGWVWRIRNRREREFELMIAKPRAIAYIDQLHERSCGERLKR